ncbi:carbohydrate sulfotransferase 11 [Tribolium madens]|uniref:carbohydrate sulfotransferase 11 n=1 Tax=Tribolium madens TaxID=41895 RepID=UPI001CF73CE9|nr:carbohydrate sulfotransferase 11 [Tribolium madens]
MRLRRRKRPEESAWRAVRRCVVFFTTICIVPVLLVLIVTTDSYMRPVKQTPFLKPQFDNVEHLEPSLHNLTGVEKRLERRRLHLQKACKLLGLNVPGNDSLHKPNPWEFLVDTKHHLVWCNVFKAASTSWMYNFNILAGYSPNFLKKSKVVPLSLARQKYPRPSLPFLKKAFNNSVSFLITRHPLERLLSAYRDKLMFALPHTHHRKLGNEIIVKYRGKVKHQKGFKAEKWPTFPEFVLYLLDCVKQGQTLDMHWTPITEFCTPCMFNFDIIAHTETLQEDQQYIIKKARLEGLVEPQWRNAGHGTTARQIRKYYSQLSRSQILQLYHIYRYDFELFNYSLNGYLELGQPDDDPSTLLAAITLKDFPQSKDKPRLY